jgi:hypothetical protein
MIAVMLSSIGSFVVVAWGFGQELTLLELRSRIDAFQRSGLDVSPLVFAYHVRWALAAASIVLSAWALLLTGRLATHGRLMLGIVAVAFFAAYREQRDASRFSARQFRQSQALGSPMLCLSRPPSC